MNDINLPRSQTVLRHLPTSFLSPPHSSPPFFGGGSLHFLVLVWVPYPHVTLQGDHDDQRPQWPSTGTKRVEVHLSFSWSISIMVNGSFWAKSRLKVCGLSRMVLQASRAMLECFGLSTDRCHKGCQGEQNLRLVIYNNDRTYRNSYEDMALSVSVSMK